MSATVFSSPPLEIAGGMRAILEAMLPGGRVERRPLRIASASSPAGAAATASDDAVFVQAASYQPRTPLGRRLWALRGEIVKSGVPLLSWDGIEQELARRRSL